MSLYQVRINGQVVIESDSLAEAEERFYAHVYRDPSCEAALIGGLDDEGDEIKLEAYSG